MSSSDITEQYLEKVYEDLQRELMSVLSQMKNRGDRGDPKVIEVEREQMKQIPLINQLLANVLRLRNCREQIKNKMNS